MGKKEKNLIERLRLAGAGKVSSGARIGSVPETVRLKVRRVGGQLRTVVARVVDAGVFGPDDMSEAVVRGKRGCWRIYRVDDDWFAVREDGE